MSLSISVIIPTYNRRRFLARAVDSALAQCEAGDEVIVIDDGSTDGTAELMAGYGSPVRYVPIANGGAGHARNVGIDLAQGDLVAFLDSDDEWFPGKLALQRGLMAARPEVLYSFSNFAVSFADGRRERRYLRQWLTGSPSWDEAIGPGEPYSRIAQLPQGVADFQVHIGDLSVGEMLDNYLLTSSVVVRRHEAGEALCFAEDLPIYEDWYCFARLSLLGPGAYLDCETTWQHGLAETRISSVGWLDRCESWNALYERVWERDEKFRSEHAATCERTLELHQLTYARALCAAGRTRQARALLAQIDSPPRSYRIAAAIPGPLLRAALGMRRLLFGWRGRMASLSS